MAPLAPLARIRSHTALRGVAALFVVAYHLQFGGGHRLAIEAATPLFARSYLFVDLFFVMSGFIIAYVSRADDPAAAAPRFGDFLFARFARLYPLHLFVLGYFLVAALAIDLLRAATGHPPQFPLGGHAWLSLATQAVLLNAWFPADPGWNIASWSISAEFVAYALFPWLAAARRAAAAPTDLLLAAVPAGFLAYVVHAGGSLDIITGLAPLRCVSGFAIGMLLFYRRRAAERLPAAALSALQLAAVAAIAAMLATATRDPPVMLPFAILVWASWTDRGLVAAWLGRPALLLLGDWSYSIYLNHLPVLAVLGYAWGPLARHLPLAPGPLRAVQIALAYALVVGISALTFRFVELPMRHRVARLLLGRHRSPLPAAPAAP